MNGAASAEKIFRPPRWRSPPTATACPAKTPPCNLEHVTFGYEKDRTILNDVSLTIPQGALSRWWARAAAAKARSPSLSGSRTGYTGALRRWAACRCRSREEEQRLRTLTLVPHNAAIFKGTVESNLRMAKPDALKQSCGTYWNR